MRQLTPTIGDAISLPTQFGDLLVRHVSIGNKEGLVITGPGNFANPIPVRIQSSCLFSESMLATNCDCAAQLHTALEIVSNGGLLVYLYEEGRGAGLKIKIDAIRVMNEQECDTAEAYRLLNLEPDLRDYQAAASIVLKAIGPDREIVLLTNNPNKISALMEHGLKIIDRKPLICRVNDAVNRYLEEKARVLGHQIDE